jgi:ATP-dependent DNA ligase
MTTPGKKRKPTRVTPANVRPMEARLVDALPTEGAWQFEPKWDGFRCLAFKDGTSVDLRAKSGKSLARYFPEIVTSLARLKIARFVVDGELLVPVGALLSFDALQARLHPAQSRIDKLAKETPALFMLFDLLADAMRSLVDSPLSERRAILEAFFNKIGKQERLRLSPFSRNVSNARTWLKRAGHGALDGVIAKPLEGHYTAGERAMLKIKCLRTADCVVGGFRYATRSSEVGSLLLGLYNAAGKLDHVGFTSGITEADRHALTKKLERLKGGPGFTGDAPGGPSRWATDRSTQWEPLKPRLVAEVRYDQVTGDRFRHGTKFLRWRPDKAPTQCRLDQLQHEVRPSEMIRLGIR